MPTCARCSLKIDDPYLVKTNDLSWHLRCLSCSVCARSLAGHSSCFIRDEKLFCKRDYNRIFTAKCFHCVRQVSAKDWVRKAGSHIYHLTCFACFKCKRQLSTGEEFGLMDNKVLCRAHYERVLEDRQCLTKNAENVGDLEPCPSTQPKAAKRPRTTFSSDQQQIMQTQFLHNKRPDAQTLQGLSDQTGLSKKVIQVWFQNYRARQKKRAIH